LIELLLDLFLGPARHADEFEVLVFTRCQLLKPEFQPVTKRVQCMEFGIKGFVELLPDTLPKVIAQAHGGVVPLNSTLDVLNRQIRQVALVLLAAAAEEVEVDAAVAFATDEAEAKPRSGRTTATP
jgi:hypothetical protein